MQNYDSYTVGVDKRGRNIRCFTNRYGWYLAYNIPDEYLKDEELQEFTIRFNLPPIPALLWNSIISLFADYAEQHLEVHVRVLQSLTKPNKFITLVPKQSVSGASAKYDYTNSINLITGEPINYPVDVVDYIDYLQIHSHNKMQVKYPSSIDDEDELNKPGLYCVISNINNDKYTCCFTFTEHDRDTSRRYYIPNNQLNRLVEGLNANGEDADTFDIIPTVYHSNVLNYIDKHIVNYKVGTRVSRPSTTTPDNYNIPLAPLTLDEKLTLIIEKHGKREVLNALLSSFHNDELLEIINFNEQQVISDNSAR